MRAARSRPGRPISILLACAALLAACGTPSSGVDAGRSEDATVETDAPVDPTAPPDSVNPVTPTTVTMDPDNNDPPPGGGVIDFGDQHEPNSYDNFLDRAFEDIEAFWAEEYPAIYSGPFTPIDHIYAMYPDRTPPAQCGGAVPYDAVEMNASFVECDDGTSVIMYDDERLVPQLIEQFGVVTVAIVAAHEYGHSISYQAGVFDDPSLRTIDLEQQADCFAGAWMGRIISGGSDLLQFTDADVKSSLAAMIFIRDPVGTDSANDPSGHGNAFDRVGAFQDGFLLGAQRCAEYPENPNPRVDLTFLSEEDFANAGNMPYPDIQEALPKALDTFWEPLLTGSGVEFTPPTLVPFPPDGPYPDCDGRSPEEMVVDPAVFCANTNTVAYNETYERALYDTYGDLAYGYPIASAYSDAVWTAIGYEVSGEDRYLFDDCLVGAWIRDIIPIGVDANGDLKAANPNQEILLSAGDLDEVVSTAVLAGDEAMNTDFRGSAFEKISAFRSGVQSGLPACQTLVEQLLSE